MSQYFVYIFLQTASKILNIRTLQDHLESKLTASLLFLHAITGCDTTSRLYSIGKVMAMNKCHQLMDSASLFMKPNQSHDDVNKHGQAALKVLYNSKPGNALTLKKQPGSVTRWRPGWSICLLNLSLLLAMQPSTIVTGSGVEKLSSKPAPGRFPVQTRLPHGG